MRCVLLFCLTLLVASTATAEPTRDILWVALQTCILAKKTVGQTFPCLAVDLGNQDQPGTGVLRAPGQPTHTVIMPTDHIVGLEAPELQHARGAIYLQEALAARHYVVDALGGRLAIEDVGLAVNAAGGRSQDHLHIHLDCVKPDVRLALRHYAAGIGESWAPMPIALQGSRFFALWVPTDEIKNFNPFAALSRLPERETNLYETSFAVISAPAGDARPGFFVLAYRSPQAHAEMLLDHRCSAVAKAAAN
jgi:CDP-diacylglycerol pyrophosphatase